MAYFYEEPSRTFGDEFPTLIFATIFPASL